MTEGQQFEEFVRSYQNMVYSTAMRLLANESDAQDISQEVFVRAYERFSELRKSPSVGGWLRTVARNLSLNHLTRYRARWSFFADIFPRTDESDEEHIYELQAETSVTDDINTAEQRESIERTLQSLPANQRVPLVLYHFEDLSYEEIAARLRVSLGKVKTDIFRGREALRKKLSSGEEPDHA